jgi:hypothetical protein
VAIKGVFKINGHDYAPYVKQKSGLAWSRENTNDEDAGRDEGMTMHTNVTSHQRKLGCKLGPMKFEAMHQLCEDLKANDGVLVDYPDPEDGAIVKRLFYNTTVSSAVTRFTDEGIYMDDVSFTLITVEEGLK